MCNLVLLKIDDYEVAAQASDILMIGHRNQKCIDDLHKADQYLDTSQLEPINKQDPSASYYLYFEGENKIECLAASKIDYLDNYDESDIVYFIDHQNCDGIVGFIHEEENLIPLIDLHKFSTRWLKKQTA